MHPKATSELYRQAYFESSVTIKTTRIKDEDCLLVQEVLSGTLWDKLIKMFSLLSSGLCVCRTAPSAWTIPSWCILAGQRLPLLSRRTGTVITISTGAPSSLVPPTHTGTEPTAQNNENLGRGRRGRKGKESLFIFSIYEMANFQHPYLRTSFCKLP